MEQGRTGLTKRGEDEREVEGEPGICWVPADIGHGVLHQKKKKKHNVRIYLKGFLTGPINNFIRELNKKAAAHCHHPQLQTE